MKKESVKKIVLPLSIVAVFSLSVFSLLSPSKTTAANNTNANLNYNSPYNGNYNDDDPGFIKYSDVGINVAPIPGTDAFCDTDPPMSKADCGILQTKDIISQQYTRIENALRGIWGTNMKFLAFLDELRYKEFVLDPFYYAASQAILSNLLEENINWVNTGNQDDSGIQWVANYPDVYKYYAESSPIAMIYDELDDAETSDAVSDDMDNLKSGILEPTLTAQLATDYSGINDFLSGEGDEWKWDTWLQTMSNPNTRQSGAMVITNAVKRIEKQKAAASIELEASASGGFRANKKCDEFTSLGTCLHWSIETPAAAIGYRMNQLVGTDLRSLETATELGEVVLDDILTKLEDTFTGGTLLSAGSGSIQTGTSDTGGITSGGISAGGGGTTGGGGGVGGGNFGGGKSGTFTVTITISGSIVKTQKQITGTLTGTLKNSSGTSIGTVTGNIVAPYDNSGKINEDTSSVSGTITATDQTTATFSGGVSGQVDTSAWTVSGEIGGDVELCDGQGNKFYDSDGKEIAVLSGTLSGSASSVTGSISATLKGGSCN